MFLLVTVCPERPPDEVTLILFISGIALSVVSNWFIYHFLRRS